MLANERGERQGRTRRRNALAELAAGADVQCLGHRDLGVIDAICVPESLDHQVREAGAFVAPFDADTKDVELLSARPRRVMFIIAGTNNRRVRSPVAPDRTRVTGGAGAR